MAKGSGTRSGLLWEVERILQELVDGNENLPQILMMENVPQVHGKKFANDFNNWCEFLESIGYVNFWQDLNAKNYGVAQNRNRTFMFSFLKSEFGNDVKYVFPESIQLEKILKDYLEDDVDEKYYINNEKADKLINTLIENGTLEKLEWGGQLPVDGTINTPKSKEIANCIAARYDCGISNQKSTGIMVVEKWLMQ